jgi:hypothetical protein
MKEKEIRRSVKPPLQFHDLSNVGATPSVDAELLPAPAINIYTSKSSYHGRDP